MQAAGSPWVVLAGDNGTGKTSILEAIYAAARGRSFRTPVLAEAIRNGAEEALAVIRSDGGGAHVLGLALRADGRELRLDQESGIALARAAQALPVEYIGGDAYRLLSGPPAARRRFLDWILFHVEPGFLAAWQAWHRAHRQRNVLLRCAAPEPELAHWRPAVVQQGERLSAMRAAAVAALNAVLGEEGGAPQLGAVRLEFRRGWGDVSLGAALERTAGRERRAGRAVVGPQYDDWRAQVAGSSPAALSRGQTKLASFLLYRAQTRLLADSGRRALLLVDDLPADLDARALAGACALLAEGAAQVWLSVLARDVALSLAGEAVRFHVEPGRVRSA